MVDELAINTPGHHFYTDTLISYGLAYPLIRTLEKPEEDLEIVGKGLNYAIIVRGLDLMGMAEAIVDLVEEKRADLERELIAISKDEAETYADGRVGLLSKKDVSEFIETLSDKNRLMKFLESLRSQSHASREGRTKAGRGVKFKLKLPLMPAAGKYLVQDLTATSNYPARYYRVCEQCAALAAIGLYCGALTAKWGKWALIATIGFEGGINGGALQYTLDLVGEEALALANLSRSAKFAEIGRDLPLSLELGLSLDNLPLRTLIQAIICLFTDAAIRGFAEANASWKALSVKFDAAKVKSESLQVRGYEEIILDPVITALAELMQKLTIDDFREKIKRLLRASRRGGPESGDAVTALESLFTFFQTRRLSDLYSFVRSFETSMERSSKTTRYKPSLTKKLCRTLITLSAKP